MVGTAKKEPKIDPLAHVQVRAREGEAVMPALSAGKPAESGHNSGRAGAIEILNGAVARLDKLDAQIAVLNRAKADVFGELADQGFDKSIVRRVIKERKIDPLVREKKETTFEAYWQVVDARKPVGEEGGE
jgi:uncharacterized protein (UPF0335 family)